MNMLQGSYVLRSTGRCISSTKPSFKKTIRLDTKLNALPTRKNIENLEKETGDALKVFEEQNENIEPQRVLKANVVQSPKPPPPMVEASPEWVTEETEFTLAKISFGSILTPSGLVVMFFGFLTYFELIPGADISPLLLVYGFPAVILGLALQYAKLDPVPLSTSKAALALRGTQMTDIQKQVVFDCTRYRYGDEEHLEEALARIFKLGRPGGLSRGRCPTLTGLKELIVDDAYCLVLEFQSELLEDEWEAYRNKIQSFFGPGIIAKILSAEESADIYLVSDKSGQGITGKERPETYAPLQPGLTPRRKQDES